MMLNITIRKMQIKTTMRYYLIPVKRVIIQKRKDITEDMGKSQPFCSVGGNVNQCSHYGK